MAKISIKKKKLKKFFFLFISLIILFLLFLGFKNFLGGKMSQTSEIAVLETNMGTIKIELYDDTPITSGNFKSLVEKGFYDGLIFHRVIDNFMIQGGCPNGDGTGGPGYKIEDEFVKGRSNTRGTISMANSGPNSGGSQFFINLVDNTYLDYDKQPLTSKHAVFGEVIEGMNIVDKIAKVQVNPSNSKPIESVVIERAYIE